MIPTPPGWMRLVRRDYVHLRSPKDRPVGEIKVRELHGVPRSARLLVAERLAANASFQPTTIGAPERLTTEEGEHAAIVRVDGQVSTVPVLCVIGMVFGEHVTAIIDALSAQPTHFAELEALTRDCVIRTELGLGVRKRRFVYRRPADWHALAHGMVTHYFAPDHPRNSAHLVVHPAVPRDVHPQRVIDSLFEDQIGALAELEYVAEEPVVARGGLRGRLWWIRSHTPSGRARSHRVVLLEDQRYYYPLHFDDGENPIDRATFDAVCASVEPLGVVAGPAVQRAPHNRLAILGLGRSSTAREQTAALAGDGRFPEVDAFHDHRREPRDDLDKIRPREMSAFRAERVPYHALYVPHGQLRAFVPHVLRAPTDPTPVICELATVHSSAQWLHLWIAAITGALRASDAFVFDSAVARDLHLEVWEHWRARFGTPIPRTFVVPTAIDADGHRRSEHARAAVRRELGVTADQALVLSLGPADGETIALWREVVAKAPDAVLLITSQDAAHVERVRRFAREQGVASRVIVTDGARPRAALLSAADVAALVTLDLEHAPAPRILDAMAHGLPVIAPRGLGCAELVRDGEDGILVDLVRTQVPDALRDSLFGRRPALHAADVSGHARCERAGAVAALVRLTTDSGERERLARHALGAVRQRHGLSQLTGRRIALIDEVAALAREAWSAEPARPLRRLVDLDDVVRELGSHRLSATTRISAARRDAIEVVADARDHGFRALAAAVIEATTGGPLAVQDLVGPTGASSEALAAAVARLVAYHVVEAEDAALPRSAVRTADSSPVSATRRDRLAVLGGFVRWSESAPHGSNHAAFAYSTGVALTRRFSEIDAFGDGEPGATFAPPDGIAVRSRELSSLTDSTDAYQLIYVAHGDQLYSAPHVLRPRTDWAPVVHEVGTTHHVSQWLHLLVGAATGAVRATDGVVFASSAAQRIHHHAWETWSEVFETAPPRSTVILNAIDCAAHRRDDALRASTRRQLGVADDAALFLVFGRLSAYTKGDQPSLVALWREVIASAPNAVLVLSGATDDEAHVERLRRMARELGVAERVIIVDNPYATWPGARTALMSAADVLLHLSTGIEESASLVILEGMAHGLPVIASRWSGASEMLRGDEGILVDVWTAPVAEPLRDGLFGRNAQLAAGEASRHAACDARQTIAAIVGLATGAERRQRAGEAAVRAVRDRHSLADAMQRRIAFFDEVAAHAEAAWTGGAPPLRRLVDVDAVLRTLTRADQGNR